MATFWHVDGAEGLLPGSTSANIGRYFGTMRTAGVAGSTYGGVTLPASRHGFGQMYAASGGTLNILIPPTLRAINVAAAMHTSTAATLIGVAANSSIAGPSITYSNGMLYATGLNAATTPIGSWNNGSWIHLEIGFYYEDINEGGNGSGYARYYVNGALAHSRTYDSAGLNFVDFLGIQNAAISGRVSDDYVIRGSSISGFQTQIGDVRVETFQNGVLSFADGDTTSATISSGVEATYGVTVSPVGSVGGSYRATVVEAIAQKGESSEPVYIKPRVVGVTPSGNDFGEAAADGSYEGYSGGGDYVTVSGAQTVGVLVDTVP